jgi:hypothetical protein
MRISILVVLALAALLCGAAPLMGGQEGLIYSFPLDSSPGWTTQGAWAFGAPTGGGGNTAPPTDCGYPDPTSGHTGANVYGYNLSGNYTASMPAQYLTTTAMNCTGVTDTTLVFWRWLCVDGTTYSDYASVQVSNNGSDWTTVWANPIYPLCDDSWQYCVYDISAVADGQATVYVRWVMGPTSSLYDFSGWNIDDVQIWSGAPGPYPVYTWNLNGVNAPGWTTEGAWAYGTPAGGGGAYGYPDPTSGHTGPNVYGYNLSGDYPNSMPAYNLTTTAIDCSGIEGTTLVFWRWLGVEPNYWDHAYVQVSNDGSTWTTVWANPTSTIDENYWQLCVYDISAIADGDSSVYIRWQMGPTDSSIYYQGWNIDDIQIWNGPPLPILAWTAYPDMSTEYPNTVQALEDKLGGGYLVQPFPTNGQGGAGDATLLSRQLDGKHVFLVPEPEAATNTQLTTAGTTFASTLQTFASNGGSVVECCEYSGGSSTAYGFLTATGLMDLTFYGGAMSGALPVAAPWHPLAAGLGSTVTAQNYTSLYTVGSNALPVVTDGAGHAAVAVADYGAGAAVALGYDFYAYDSDAARILANAVQYPRNARRVLLYDDGVGASTHVGAEALRRLGYAFTETNQDDFDQALTSGQWDVVVLDNPYFCPYGAGEYGYYDSLLDYLGVWGKSAGNSWRLDASRNPELAAAYDVEAATILSTLTPVYDWIADPLFTTPNSVPDLTTWSDLWGIDGFELTAVGEGVAHAGYTASPTADKAAVVVGNYGTTIVSGFLWDDRNQDADSDGIQDVVELVMNQLVHLTKNPYVDMGFSPSETTTGATVDFTGHLSANAYGSTWWFGDGFSDSGTSVSHSYAHPGFYTVSFVSADSPSMTPDHYSIRTVPRQMVVGFPDTPAGFWSLHHIVACYEGGLVGGYGDGYHPDEIVTRAAMAVYVARGMAGGDAGVPDGPVTPTFADVGTGYWAYKYIEYCYAHGIVGGYADGYHPEENVNRAQMAVYAARVRAGSDAAVPLGPVTPFFPDVGTGYWAYKYIEYCHDQDIVGGYADGYHPEEEVNRAQMPVYMQRLFQLWMPYS